MRILVADPVAEEGVQILRGVADVDVITKQTPEQLIQRIPAYDALVVRSETKVTAPVIEAGTRLRAIGRAGVGVDNIDVEAATRKGITVVNAPTGNTIAATEHTIALLLALARNVPQAHMALKQGRWDRAKFTGVELRNKVLGVIGLGKIGSEVARRAIGLEMRVIGYDPFVSEDHARNLGVEVADFDTVLRMADFLTVHIPLSSETRSLIGEKQLAMMKPTARIINVARGGIIDEEALYRAVEEGRIAGAAIDVFSQEPTTDNILIKSDKIIVTPHLGASTEEAQVQVAVDVAEQIVEILNGRPARYAVNLPLVPAETMKALQPYLPLAEALGAMAAQLAHGQVSGVTVTYRGEVAEHDTALLKAAVIKGLFHASSEDQINLVNATFVARERGLRLTEEKSTNSENYTSLIRVAIDRQGEKTVVAGTVLRGEPRVVQINDYDEMDIAPVGTLLLCHNTDRPGVIGRVGTLLGQRDINIAFMSVARDHPRGRALMIVGVDEPISDAVLNEVRALDGIDDAVVVSL
ncbi:MAG: phosphoglycerate dehydrogenase [Dehalococcoidia bacterium]|nr:MAG: phosphoglycerate dehydrogenase [Dehalococcoidia bacterium]